ncbi:MAG: spondin domain-containing protein [Planctomycetota bacterium]
MLRTHFTLVASLASTLAASTALGQASTPTASTPTDLKVTITNEGNADFTLTPLWFAFQNGGFDSFDAGSLASPAIEAIAEDGIVDGLIMDFDASGQPGNRQGVVTAPGGFPGAPVIENGETGTAFITPINPAAYQYFSFASMVIPTNDNFIGNDDPLAYQVFDAAGNINDPSGTFTITVLASDIWDAGTELNNGLGAPFSTAGGTATDTTDPIALEANNLADFVGITTPSGVTITNLYDPSDVVATITISQIPEPATLSLLALAPLGMVTRRRR